MKIFGKEIFQKRNINAVMMPPEYAYGYGPTSSNPRADATSLAAIDLICNAIAGLSVDVYDRQVRQKQDGYFLQTLLKNPNADETKSVFFYQLAHDYFEGNVYLYKYVDNATGEVLSLFRLDPNKVSVERNIQNQKIFTYNNQTYDYRNILHIPSRYLYDGIRGYSVYDYAKNVFATNLEIDDYTNNAFNNSLGKRLVIDISNAFPNATAEQVEAIRQKYINNYTGSANAGKPIVKTNKVEMTALDSGLPDSRAAQLVENRQFQESEIGKMFPIALSILKGDNSYGSLENLYMLFVDTCLKPICNVFEESFQKLLPLSDRNNLYVEYNYNSLLKTDLSTRIETYNKQIYSGILSINEVRAKENLTPIEAGDTHWMPANNIPIRQDVEDAMLASAKLKAQELLNPSSGIGDDKL